MAPMEDLDALLQSLPTLKPPGASKPKIDAITTLCIQNIQAAPTIVKKIYAQFQNSPASHKLGVLYVVDSVTRQWVGQSGQARSHNAGEGTYTFGVQKMTETLPLMMNPLIESASDSHKEKLSKLVDIWEKSKTFPLSMLNNFREKLKGPKSVPQSHMSPQKNVGSTAPIPAQAAPFPGPEIAGQRPDTNATLAALVNVLNPANPPQPTYVSQTAAPQYGTNGHAPTSGTYYAPSANPPAAQAAQTALGMPIPNDLIMQLFQAVTQGAIRPEQATQLLEMVQNSGVSALIPPPIPSQPAGAHQNGQNNGQQQGAYQAAPTQDSRLGGQNAANGQQGLYRDRSQSPRRRVSSPNRRGSPPQRRDSPTYGVYDPSSVQGGNGGRQQQNDRGRGRGRRQRSPPGQRRQQSPVVNAPPRGMKPKFVEYDNSLPRDCIRVLSRTLFVGGATGTERELRDIFSKFGKVQTCIVNHDKRHAFVKMVNRRDSLSAREGMEQLERSNDPSISAKARQTRWGVGFGPRDCADYQTGISIIPITRLTDADLKWATTAEYGGTGGIPVAAGMVFEEPDIEIGAGVSSKAISRRIIPETTGTRRGGFGGGAPVAPRGGGPEPNQSRYHISLDSRATAALGIDVRPRVDSPNMGVMKPEKEINRQVMAFYEKLEKKLE